MFFFFFGGGGFWVVWGGGGGGGVRLVIMPVAVCSYDSWCIALQTELG
jgi:hypothetical protein